MFNDKNIQAHFYPTAEENEPMFRVPLKKVNRAASRPAADECGVDFGSSGLWQLAFSGHAKRSFLGLCLETTVALIPNGFHKGASKVISVKCCRCGTGWGEVVTSRPVSVSCGRKEADLLTVKCTGKDYDSLQYEGYCVYKVKPLNRPDAVFPVELGFREEMFGDEGLSLILCTKTRKWFFKVYFR